jgi:hypothetical protein
MSFPIDLKVTEKSTYAVFDSLETPAVIRVILDHQVSKGRSQELINITPGEPLEFTVVGASGQLEATGIPWEHVLNYRVISEYKEEEEEEGGGGE